MDRNLPGNSTSLSLSKQLFFQKYLAEQSNIKNICQGKKNGHGTAGDIPLYSSQELGAKDKAEGEGVGARKTNLNNFCQVLPRLHTK